MTFSSDEPGHAWRSRASRNAPPPSTQTTPPAADTPPPGSWPPFAPPNHAPLDAPGRHAASAPDSTAADAVARISGHRGRHIPSRRGARPEPSFPDRPRSRRTRPGRAPSRRRVTGAIAATRHPGFVATAPQGHAFAPMNPAEHGTPAGRTIRMTYRAICPIHLCLHKHANSALTAISATPFTISLARQRR